MAFTSINSSNIGLTNLHSFVNTLRFNCEMFIEAWTYIPKFNRNEKGQNCRCFSPWEGQKSRLERQFVRKFFGLDFMVTSPGAASNGSQRGERDAELQTRRQHRQFNNCSSRSTLRRKPHSSTESWVKETPPTPPRPNALTTADPCRHHVLRPHLSPPQILSFF